MDMEKDTQEANEKMDSTEETGIQEEMDSVAEADTQEEEDGVAEADTQEEEDGVAEADTQEVEESGIQEDSYEDMEVFEIEDDPENQEEKTGSHAGKKVLIAVGALVAVLLVVYVGVSVYFMNRFLPQTTLNGMDVSAMTASAVEQKESESVSNYELTIVDRDGTAYTITGSDFSLEMQWNDGITNLAKKQNGFTWIASLFSATEFELEGTLAYDEEQLTAALAELAFMQAENQTAAVDASVSAYGQTDGYTLVPSEAGTEIDEEILQNAVAAAILSLTDTLNLEEIGCYLEPEILDDNEELLAAIDKLNTYTGTEITYTVGDDTFALDGGTISEWLSVSDDFSVALNEDEVAEYVASLADTYDTYNSDKTFETSYGKTITITNIHYGWQVDQETETSQIIEEILAGTSESRDLNYTSTANSHTGNDYGDSYIEVNLTAQHLYLYDNGTLVLDTDCVTGTASDSSRITPDGIFTIMYKQKDAILNGVGYSTPVSFWMPFYNGCGLHDATWRSNFGGTIYKNNGSHGCVNLPYSAAQTIYNTIDAGWPIMIYYLDGTESGTTQEKSAAEKVVNAIDKLSDSVTLDDEDAITNARTMYDELSSTAKTYVTNYDTLTAAETALEKLQEEAAEEADSESEEAEDSDSDDEDSADDSSED